MADLYYDDWVLLVRAYQTLDASIARMKEQATAKPCNLCQGSGVLGPSQKCICQYGEQATAPAVPQGERADAKNCGSCAHWDAKNKRNCSTPESPHYMAGCLFDVDGLLLPHCVAIEQTYELNGCNCPRYFARTQTFRIRLTPKEDNP